MLKDDFIASFRRLESTKDLLALIARYGLTTEGLDQNPRSQVYQVVGGTIEGSRIVVTHRWHDPSGPFQNVPDVAKVELDVDGQRAATREWTED